MLLKIIVLLEYFDIFNDLEHFDTFNDSLIHVVKILCHSKSSAYYPGIMPNPFRCLLCQKLCWYNWPGPKCIAKATRVLC